MSSEVPRVSRANMYVTPPMTSSTVNRMNAGKTASKVTFCLTADPPTMSPMSAGPMTLAVAPMP